MSLGHLPKPIEAKINPVICSSLKFFVTGPQRSGSTFVSHCIAEEYSAPHVDEAEFDVYSTGMMHKLVEDKQSWVVHGPGLFTEMFEIQEKIPDVIFVVIRRSVEEIIESQERINWSDEIERKRLWMYSHDTRPVSEIKYYYWDKWKNYLNQWIEYQYADFAGHPLWVEKDQRKLFSSKQWKSE